MSEMVETTTRVQGLEKFEVRDLPAQDYLGKRFVSPLDTVGHGVQAAMGELYERITSSKVTPVGPPFLIASIPTGGTISVEVGAPCSPVPEPLAGQHKGRLEAGNVAVALYRGPYEQVGPVYSALFAWVAEHGYRPAGAPREVYLNDPGTASSPAEYLTEVMLPIA